MECLFADPIADVALLGEPDSQVLYDECVQYCEFIEAIPPLAFGETVQVPPEAVKVDEAVQILDLAGEWRKVLGEHYRRVAGYRDGGIFADDFDFAPGMSGSPILNGEGDVVGLVSTDGTCPRLPRALPVWLLE